MGHTHAIPSHQTLPHIPTARAPDIAHGLQSVHAPLPTLQPLDPHVHRTRLFLHHQRHVHPPGRPEVHRRRRLFLGHGAPVQKALANKGLLDAKVGYIGGDLDNPSYRAVCGGKTGHAETVQLIFEPEKVSYRQLLEFFYRTHDPTTLNRQGPDTGPQYRSAIYYHNDEQEKIAREVTKQANEKWWHNGIVTEIAPAGKWWTAEEYHQLYLDRNPGGYECPSHFLRTLPPLE